MPEIDNPLKAPWTDQPPAYAADCNGILKSFDNPTERNAFVETINRAAEQLAAQPKPVDVDDNPARAPWKSHSTMGAVDCQGNAVLYAMDTAQRDAVLALVNAAHQQAGKGETVGRRFARDLSELVNALIRFRGSDFDSPAERDAVCQSVSAENKIAAPIDEALSTGGKA